jgi:oligopeptide transport system substrate-binding protein
VEQEVTRVISETVVEEGETVEVTRVVTEEVVVEVPAEVAEEVMDAGPVTYYYWNASDIPTLDPQVGEDVISINWVENLFVNLTNYDLDTNEVVPEAATDWTVSDDGLVYTFNLRTDIPWVNYNPVTGETTQEVEFDEDGNEVGPRFVTANDFEYGIKRACDPNIGSYYSTVIAPLIVGCEDVLNVEDPSDEEAVAAAKDAVGVTALDESTLEITLAFPASYFMTMTPMWTLAATPSWAIEEHGADEWYEAGRIVSNGRFSLDEWVHDVRYAMVRNPLFPADLAGDGNIERVVTAVVPDRSTGYALWLNNEVDYTGGIPGEELEAFLEEFPDEAVQIPDLAVFYISFRETKPPFDDPAVRRAFSAAFDRATFVDEVRQGQGLPMTHFAPPGIFGAPPIDEVGIGFDPEFAQAQLAEAGYPGCEGFPQVTLLGYSGQSTLNWIEYAQGQWETHLGCSADLIQIEQQPFSELLAATAADTPDAEAPHMWTLGWGPDYADENNWVGDVLWCGNTENRQKRECGEVDDLIIEAREETDPARRIELYRQIEEMFFGEEGETPFFPIFLRIQWVGVHDWYDFTPALFGGQQRYNATIDQDAQLSARGGG